MTRSNHSFSGVASLKKQWQTVPRSAIFALVLLVAIGGSLAYFYRPDHQSPPSQSTPAEPQETSGLQLRNSMQEVQNVPAGLFNYGGAHTFAALTSAGINEAISQAHPEFRLRYTEPFDAEPGSGTGINMLINGELSFAQSARPLEENDHNKAKALGFALEQLPVAIDGVAFYTHPDLEIPGLSIDQLQAIFRGQVTNWKQVGGPDLAISPVALDPKTTSVLKLLLGGEGDDLSPKVQIVRDYTTAIRKIIATPGGISYGSAPLVATQESIRPIALAKANTKEYMSPLTEDRQINAQAFLDGTYPMTRRLFIIIRRDGSVDEKAGISYTSFLLSKEGQEIIKKAGFVPLR
ncbi:substrate-binding domain-containing protein [Phormidium tenue FACHB-886]|nr:substrate-binding domain-containing protein [Phormidium tenue FACHB-886]